MKATFFTIIKYFFIPLIILFSGISLYIAAFIGYPLLSRDFMLFQGSILFIIAAIITIEKLSKFLTDFNE